MPEATDLPSATRPELEDIAGEIEIHARKAACRLMKRGIFRQFPDLALEDLTQTGCLKVSKEWDKYNPEHSIGAWVNRIVTNELLDLSRQRYRERNRVVRTAPEQELSERLEPLIDFVETLKAQLQQKVPEPTRKGTPGGRVGYGLHAKIIMAAIVTKMGWTARHLSMVLRTNAVLRQSIGLPHAPGQATVYEAVGFWKLAGILSDRKIN